MRGPGTGQGRHEERDSEGAGTEIGASMGNGTVRAAGP